MEKSFSSCSYLRVSMSIVPSGSTLEVDAFESYGNRKPVCTQIATIPNGTGPVVRHSLGLLINIFTLQCMKLIDIPIVDID